ncbi:MAG: hypothetical protein ACE5IA_04115 [Dehalococcoidia bacterium]
MLNRTSVQTPLYLALALILGLGFSLVFAQTSRDWPGLVLVVLAIAVIVLLILPHMAWRERSRFLMQVLIVGLILKLGTSMVRLWASFDLYQGVADASGYHGWGILIAQHLRQMEFDRVAPFLESGTNFVRFFTGLVYAAIGPTLYGAYLIYGLLAFIGAYYFYRAFREAFPEGNRVLYALLIFFFPSILFWPNGMSKDALMLFSIGLSTYGSVLLLRQRLWGMAPLALGLFGALSVRPHVAGILAVSLALAFLIPKATKVTTRAGTYLVGMAIAASLLWFMLPRAMAFIGLEQLSLGTSLDYYGRLQSLTFQGGSAFRAPDIRNPLAFPMAAVTVLFRPFPWETHNIQALVQSLVGVLLLGVVLWRIRSLTHVIVSSLSDPVLRYVLTYIAIFIVAFSFIGNFGILARQQTMVLPFVFMLLAYSPRQHQVMSPVKEIAT